MEFQNNYPEINYFLEQDTSSVSYQEIILEKQDLIIEQLVNSYELGFHSLVLFLTIIILSVIYHVFRQFII